MWQGRVSGCLERSGNVIAQKRISGLNGQPEGFHRKSYLHLGVMPDSVGVLPTHSAAWNVENITTKLPVFIVVRMQYLSCFRGIAPLCFVQGSVAILIRGVDIRTVLQ